METKSSFKDSPIFFYTIYTAVECFNCYDIRPFFSFFLSPTITTSDNYCAILFQTNDIIACCGYLNNILPVIGVIICFSISESPKLYFSFCVKRSNTIIARIRWGSKSNHANNVILLWDKIIFGKQYSIIK